MQLDDRTDHTAETREALQRAALAVSSASGEAVFPELVRYLATILQVEMAFIALTDAQDPARLRMLALYLDGRISESFSYPMAGTPCEQVVGQRFRMYPSGLCRLFPLDSDFAATGMDSYAGFPLRNTRGEPLGLIAVASRLPLGDDGRVESILQIFAVRAAAEIERVRAEEALRASEASYRAIFEAAADAIFVHDWDTGAILDVNPQACATYGYTREEFCALPIAALGSGVPPSTAEDAARHIAEAKLGRAVQVEWQRRNKDGTLHWDEVRLRSAVIGGERRILAFTRDITARKLAEEAVRASEAQYRAIFKASADALVLWNSQLQRVDINPAYERMYGVTREEVLRGEHPSESVPGYAERRRDMVRRTLAGEPCHEEIESVRKNGERFLAEVRTIPITHRGEPHVLAICRDVTERRRAEEALRASEEQYRLLFEMESDAIILADADTLQHVDANRAALELYGYTREEMLALRSTDLSAEPQSTRSAMHAGTGTARVPLRYHRKKDGTVFPVEITANFFELKGRRMMLAAIRDITERKLAEEERARLEAQLRQAQKMEAIGQLTGGIAHDFNNILTSVNGYIQMGAERAAALGDAKLAHYLEEAGTAARRAGELIQQMLTFSRGQRSDRRITAIGPLVRESVKLLRSTLMATIELECVVDEDVPAAMLDPVQIGQVLLNLAINARDAMGGAGRLAIAVRRCDGLDAVCASCRQKFHGAWIGIAVRDTGHGIAPHVRDRMFEPFFSTKEVGKGSGMGLAIAHGIVHGHGGHILVESLPGAGTTFTVCLPQARTGPDAAVPHPGSRRPADGRLSGRVLVVEDDELVARYMRDLLDDLGLDAEVKRDPREAAEWLERDPARVDVVITDLAMAGMDGMQLSRRIRELRRDLPVILYTGYSDGVTARAMEECGVSALLAKPLERAALVTLLRRYLEAT